MNKFLEANDSSGATKYLTTNTNLCVFDIFGIVPKIHTEAAVTKRWKELSKLLHPDKNPHDDARVTYKNTGN